MTTEHRPTPSPAHLEETPRHRDWREMTREDFDVDAGPPRLFDLGPGAMIADDGHGTGDLLELLEDGGG
jgi:hypothetical protein